MGVYPGSARYPRYAIMSAFPEYDILGCFGIAIVLVICLFVYLAMKRSVDKFADDVQAADPEYKIPKEAEYGTLVEHGGDYPHPLDDSKGYSYSGEVPIYPTFPHGLHAMFAENFNRMLEDEGLDDIKYVEAAMVMVEKAYLEHAGVIAIEHQRLKGFWNELASYMFEHWDMDGGTFQDLGVKHQLLTEVVFDPEGAHADLYVDLAEPGDTIFINALQEDRSETTNDDAGDDEASPTG